MSAFSLAALASEINTDPVALGYASHVSAHDRPGIATILNTTRAGVGTVFRNDVQASEILAALTWSEISALTTNNWLALHALLLPGVVDATQATIRAIFVGLFPVGTFPLTNAALVAVGKKASPTRAEELWGYGTVITDNQIAAAGIN